MSRKVSPTSPIQVSPFNGPTISRHLRQPCEAHLDDGSVAVSRSCCLTIRFTSCSIIRWLAKFETTTSSYPTRSSLGCVRLKSPTSPFLWRRLWLCASGAQTKGPKFVNHRLASTFTWHDESWKNIRTSECGFRLIKHKSGTLFSSSLGLGVSSLDILPVTEDARVIHRSPAVSSKADFSRDLLAITWLMSRAHSVITYTGNVGYWIALFRGHGGRLHQLRYLLCSYPQSF